jgi:hypothetical protein
VSPAVLLFELGPFTGTPAEVLFKFRRQKQAKDAEGGRSIIGWATACSPLLQPHGDVALAKAASTSPVKSSRAAKGAPQAIAPVSKSARPTLAVSGKDARARQVASRTFQSTAVLRHGVQQLSRQNELDWMSKGLQRKQSPCSSTFWSLLPATATMLIITVSPWASMQRYMLSLHSFA